MPLFRWELVHRRGHHVLDLIDFTGSLSASKHGRWPRNIGPFPS
jgi:hypothetical protein